MSCNYRFALSHTVLYSETSARGFLSLPSFFSLFQEAAVLHADALDFGTDYCRKEGLMWVLSRLFLDIHSFPEHRSRLSVLTWPKRPKGPFASRDYILESENGDHFAKATSSWLLLNTETMRPVRPGPLFEGYPFDQMGEAIEGSAPKIGQKTDVCDTELEVTARYSDLDMNYHVNNTRYVRWFLDCYAPEEITTTGNLQFSINYLKATSYNDRITLCRFDTDEYSTVRGFKQPSSPENTGPGNRAGHRSRESAEEAFAAQIRLYGKDSK